jgi:coenzyme F420-0:L-glutamate ligase/coenzyme F420-1:gamma-L-glutamate ligase
MNAVRTASLPRRLVLTGLTGIPEIEFGAPLARILLEALGRIDIALENGDILVIAQKIVSKAEGRRVRLRDVEPTARAVELGRTVQKDPRLVELMLRESREVLRVRPGAIIVEHRLGFVMANAGIDRSNCPEDHGESCALLLPENPDASAERLREALRAASGMDVGIVVNDSFGRAWRNGVAGVAIGVAGLPALIDMRGTLDRQKRPLEVTQVAAADELAAAASLVMGQADESIPAVLARGFPYAAREGSARELVRPRAEDLFR